LSIIVASVLFYVDKASAQGYTYEQLEEAFVAINSQLPQVLGNGLEMLSVSINREEVVWCYTVNDIGNSMSNIMPEDSNIKARVKSMISAVVSDEDLKNMFIDMAKLGIGLRLQMKSVNTGKTLDVAFLPDEVMSIAITPVISPIDWVKNWHQSLISQLPLAIGMGITMTDAILTESMMQIVCFVNESMFSFDTMLANKENARESICNLLFSGTDGVVIMQNTQMALAGLALSYKYVGSQSGKSFSIDFSNQELKDKMQIEPSEVIDSIAIFGVVDSIAVK